MFSEALECVAEERTCECGVIFFYTDHKENGNKQFFLELVFPIIFTTVDNI